VRFGRTRVLADTAAGHPVRAAFGTNPPGAEAAPSPDAINVANTSVVSHGGELMTLWEGGSATRMDAQTLATKGLKVWSPDYAGMPFSAHPKIEPDGSLWNFGVTSSQGLLSIYRVKASGELAQAVTIKVPEMSMVHDFAVTEQHLVFLLPPLVFDRARADAGETFLDSHVWKPQLGMRVLLLHKDRLQAPRWFELPAGFVFHIGNACEDRGVIRLDTFARRVRGTPPPRSSS
jgi:carotenoid cleavage dioxygenase